MNQRGYTLTEVMVAIAAITLWVGGLIVTGWIVVLIIKALSKYVAS